MRRLARIFAILTGFGFMEAVHDLTIRAVNHICLLKILRCVKIESVDPQFLQCGKSYESRFLSAAELSIFAEEREYALSASFVESALAKGDQCYGLLQAGALASYGWYSNRPTTIEPDDLVLHFSPEYVYMYKGFTLDRYRGQRLHAIGMTQALDHSLKRGYKGIVSYVESNNFASLRSVYRMGYQLCGNIYVARIFGRYVIHSDEPCRRLGLRLEVGGGETLSHPHPARAQRDHLDAGA